jgi:site-specific DNA-methyltransferase (adenine-specific)
MALVLHGDCLEVMKTLPDKSVDLFVCDLPYGCLGPQKKGGGVPREDTEGAFGGCAWDIPLDLGQFWAQIKRLCRTDHTPVLMFCTTRFGVDLINSNPEWFRYDLVWNKMRGISFLLANKMPMRSHEMIYVFAKKGAHYYRTDITGDFPAVPAGKTARGGSVYGMGMMRKDTEGGRRCVWSIVDAPNPPKKGKHPTQKPDELYEWLITRYSKEGDTVLDPTAGSFASVFAAERLGRHGIGIEKDDAFFVKYSGAEEDK